MEVHPRLSIRLNNGNLSNEHTTQGQLKIDMSYQNSDLSSLLNILEPAKHSSKFPNNLLPRKFELFDLEQLKPSKQLSKNRKYMSIYESLKAYNQKIKQNSDECIVSYKFHQFLYSSLQTCHSKTPTQINTFLAKISKFQEESQQKRGIFVVPKKKRHGIASQDQYIRQNFKSYLPLQIDEYRRKKYRPILLGKKKTTQKNKKIGLNYFNFQYDGQDYSDEEEQKKISKRLEEEDNYKQEKKLTHQKRQKQVELPNLKIYRSQILKIKRKNEEKDDKNCLKQIKKNQSRLHTQTATNFYQINPNSKDILTKTASNFGKQRKIDQENLNDSFQDIQNCLDQKKETKTLGRQTFKQIDSLFSQTIQNFSEIKKKKLYDVRNENKKIAFNDYKDQQNVLESDQIYEEPAYQNDQNVEITPITLPLSIDGVNLMKNPYQIVRTKKAKKKK